MRNGVIRGWVYVPYEAVQDLAALKGMLTYKPRFAEEGDGPVYLFSDRPDKRMIGVPRAFALHRFPWLPLTDQTSMGVDITVPRLPDPNHPRVRSPQQQAQFMEDLYQGLREHRTFVGMAPTGSGKTVCALHASARIGGRTLILVHLERLMLQWIDEIKDKLGVSEERIGIVQSGTCQYHDRDYVVGMLHTVIGRRFDPDFYRAFRLSIYDEVHKVGTRFFSQAVPLFPSYYKLGLSATPTREDGGDRVIFWHLGPIRVVSEAEALPIRVFPVFYQTRSKLWGRTHGARVQCLTRDVLRNQLIVQNIVQMYQAGRNALVVGESVQHLQGLMAQCKALGIPAGEMGQFTGDTQRVAEINQPNGTKLRKVIKKKQTNHALSFVKENARIIFATYGMMTEGIDIPRLDAGIDVTPRGKATQLIGRVRRPMPNKRMPIWVTIVDTSCSISLRYYEKRCRDYQSCGAEVVDYGSQESHSHGATGGRS